MFAKVQVFYNTYNSYGKRKRFDSATRKGVFRTKQHRIPRSSNCTSQVCLKMETKANFQLSCLFCGKGIDAIKRQEKRTEYDERDKYEKTVTVAIPCEKDQYILEFKPLYSKLLSELICQAEKEVRKVFEAAGKECEKVLKPFEVELGEEIYLEVGRNEGGVFSRGEFARNIYGLSTYWYKYKIEGIDEIKPRFVNFLAHGNCVKQEITFENFLSSSLIKPEFDEWFPKFSIPYKNIYDKIKHEKVKISAKKFDFRDYLKTEHKFG